MSNPDFLPTYVPLANDIATQTGVDPSVVLGIIDTETGGGTRVSGNNIFGISPGNRVAQYPDVQTASQAFVNLMQTPRYRSVAAQETPQGQAAALVQAGYNTVNPKYASLVAQSAAQARAALGVDDTPPAPPGATQVAAAAPDYNNAPTAAPPGSTPPAAGSAKQRVLQELQAQPPGASGSGAPGSTAKERLLKGDLAPAAGPPIPPPVTTFDEYGRPLTDGVPPSMTDELAAAAKAHAPNSSTAQIFPAPAPGAVRRIVEAGREGATNAPDASSWAPAGVQLGRYIVNPLLETGGALFRGGQQFLSEAAEPVGRAVPFVGGPGLGRDVAALPEAFPTGDYGQPTGPGSAVQARNALSRPTPFSAQRPISVQEITDAIRRSDAGNALNPDAAARGAAAEAPAAAPANDAGTAAPRAVGADVTTQPIPAATDSEKIAHLQKSVNQSAEDRAGPRQVDSTAYVQGIPERMKPSQDLSVQNAQDHKWSYMHDDAYRTEYDANQAERNRGMVDLLAGDAKDQPALDQAYEARSQVSPDEMGVFDKEQPTDARGLLAAIDQQLAGRAGKRGFIKSTLQGVRDSLFDADGNLETSPSLIYGARQNVTDLLQAGAKGGTETAAKVKASKSILEGLLPHFDQTILDGAPQYDQYMQSFRELSKPIDQMEWLQRYQAGGKKLTDKDGYLDFKKVQTMLGDALEGMKAKGVDKAKSLTPEQLGNIEAVRNELATDSLLRRRMGVPGSPTAALLNRAAEQGATPVGIAVKGAAGLAGHGLLAASPAAGWGNAVLGAYQATVKPAMAASKLRREAAAAQAASAARKRDLLTPINPLDPRYLP
jgi:hypothetical protein